MYKGQVSNDDWSGITDPSERRKIQNRLNQRAKRQRKKIGNGIEQETGPSNDPWLGQGVLVPITPNANRSLDLDQNKLQLPQHTIFHAHHASNASLATLTMLQKSFLTEDQTGESSQGKLIPPLILEFPSHIGLPRVLFPLSPDHRLITLVQYNVKRGLLTNMALLENLKHMPPEYESALALLPLTIPPPDLVPATLLPTRIQSTTPHNPLIDSVPYPELRNNLILKGDKYEMDELASDAYGGLFVGFSDLEMRGFMVWGDPWKADQWEITEGFAKKWGFLLAGCVDLIESTNRWRESRGEERLIVEI